MAEEAPPKKKATTKEKKAIGPCTGIADLGKTLRDRVTGLTGIAFQYSLLQSGTEQIAVQPKGDGSAILEGKFIDIHTLEVLDEGIKGTVPSPEPFIFENGDEVEDRVSKLRGIVVGLCTFVNGCAYAVVAGRVNGDGEIPEHHIAQSRLKLIKKGKVAVGAKRPLVSTAAPKKAGGPMRAIARAS